MNTERICPSCRKPLPPETVGELCPECLMKAGFESTAGEPGGPRRFLPPAVEELTKLFPQLEILELLGQGGMGAVYKARQPGLDRLVALKILPPETTASPRFTERFTREARALAKLNHPNIVSVYDFGTAGGLHYFLMEYVDGLNLRQLERAGRLFPREALQIIPQICDALQFAHEEGIVHRDIKPENVMLDKKGRVKIADFGLAKLLGEVVDELRLTGAQDVMGTPNYMAPEQIEKPQEVDHRADIYSLGVVFYELLTGELPIGKFAPPSKKVELDVRLDEVVLHTLEKEPNRRYQHASQVKTDVVNIAQTPRPSAAQAPELADPEFAMFEDARRQAQGPGIGLIVTGILNWVSIPLFALIGAKIGARTEGGPISNVTLMIVLLAALFLSAVILVAGFKMKRLQGYRLAVVGSLLAIFISPGNLVGLPIGIWSLVVLSQKHVRNAFGKDHPLLPSVIPPPPARSGAVWKAALVVLACFALVALLAVGALLVSIFMPAIARARLKAAELAGVTESEWALVSLTSKDANNRFLDVDGFRTVEPLEQFSTWSRDGRQEWLRDNGVDLMVARNADHWSLLSPVDNRIKLAKVPQAIWNEKQPDLDFWLSHTPAEPAAALQSGAQDPELLAVQLDGRPAQPDHTYVFQTANGAKGLLTVSGLNVMGGNTVGLKLRLKTFQHHP